MSELNPDATTMSDLQQHLDELKRNIDREVSRRVKNTFESNTQLKLEVRNLRAEVTDLRASNKAAISERDKLHGELVEVRSALATVSAERDSLRTTLASWEAADTAPFAKVPDVADHVMPPVLDRGEPDPANDERDAKLEFRNVVPRSDRKSGLCVRREILVLDKGKGLKMTTTELPFLHRVRLARCEALAKEFAELRARLPFTLGVDQHLHKAACAAVEADLVQAAGTAEQRAIEAAQDQLGDQLAEALIALATSATARGGQPLATRLEAVEILRTKFLWLRFPEQSDYTSEAEEILTRLRALAAALHTDSELKSLTGAEVLGRFMQALSVP